MTRDGLGVLDPDALCPLTPSRRDGLLAVRLESHRGLDGGCRRGGDEALRGA